MNPASRFGVDGDSSFQVLWEDGERVFCRAWRRGAGGGRDAVFAVSHAGEHPIQATLDRLAHEYGLKDELDGPWAARPLELGRHRGRTMLVLEDPGGEPLDRLLGAPLEVGRFLRFAIAIAAALSQMHWRGLVHKDIKPINILVNRTTEEVKLTGFGIASRLSRERQSPAPPETIAGTLAYMAPEQTGRMNRSIDSRSDLYALGVTFYQMLTGCLPFTASDPMEWVHCHLARRPMPPASRLKEVPGAVSAIVMKLLAKTAEERYQTAAGVERDLRRCLAEWERQGRIDDFSLGEQDTPDRLLIPEKLYGREHEIAALLAAFDRVVKSGASELVLVSGYSGIGKSSVVNELHKVLVPPRGLFAAGKFDQYKRDIPYATLAQALHGLVQSLLGKSDAVLAPWREALREALGPNGQIMIDLVPALEPLIGPQPPVSELPPQDAQRRFHLVFRRLLGVFARPEHPLALFLDDLQWLDVATLELLEHLATEPELRNLLLVGAYRDNEVTPTHPLTRRLAAIRSAGGRVQEIVLAPLRLVDVGRLIADALRCEPERVAPLARLVHEKAAGNPFFTIQFLTALAEEGLLAFDHGGGCWSWELERIRAKGYTDNVVDLMLGKLRRLPAATQHALRLLACLGNSAAISTLALVRGESEEALHAALWAAVRAGLAAQLEGPYRFVHDHVQEAAYGLIPTGERAAEHLRIGRLLAAHTPAEAIEEHVFEIVSQLNRGAALLTSGEERERLAELNLLAGKRAKAATAYTSALTYFVTGAALLSEDCWRRRRELAFALALNRAECEFLTGALADAESRLTVLSSRAEDLLDLAAVTCLQEDLYTTLDRSDRSIEVALDYLRRVGVAWSAHPTQDEVRREYERMWQQIGSRPIEALLDLPRMADPVWQGTMDVLTAVVSPALYTDQNLYCVVIGRMANLSLEHGNSDASSYAYAILGTVLGGRFGDYKAAFRFGELGFNLAAKRGLDRFKARIYLIFGHHIIPWTKPIRTSRSLMRLALDAAQEVGDLTYGAFGRTHLVTHLLASGDPLDKVQREAEAGLDVARQARFGLVIDRITGQVQLIRTLRGLTPIFGRLNDAGFEEERFEQHLEADPRLALAACWYWIRKLQARVLAGDHAAAIAAAAQADCLLWTSLSFFERAEYHFYAALARAALCDAAPDADRARHLEALAAHHRQLLEWAENCPENFETRAALVGAEIARHDGRELDAERLYEQAIYSARANGFVHNEALANEFAARFYAARGFETISQAYLRNARYCYLSWGADAKVRQLEGMYPHLRAAEPAHDPTSTMATPVEHLDLATVIKVSQAVSGEIVLEKMLDTLMRTAIAHAGAERGLLILSHGAEPRIKAEVTAGGDTVLVDLADAPVTAAVLPETVLHHVLRTRESVILDDAATQPSFAGDIYIRQRQSRSILCLPLINQAKLSGVLYLENNLAPRAFAPARIAVLKLLASQAAISLENARLYDDLAGREAKIRRLVDANIIGIVIRNNDGSILEANDAFLRIVGYDREDLVAGRLRWTDLTTPESRDRTAQALAEYENTGTHNPFEKEYFRKDGSRVPVLTGAAMFEEGRNEGVAFVLDLTERKHAEEAARRSENELRDVIDTIPAMAWTALPDGTNDFMNHNCREFTEAPSQDASGAGSKLSFHPADVATHVEKWCASLATGKPFENEARLRRARDGEFRWFLHRAVPLRDDNDSILKWYGISTEIDDRKRAEQALREREAKIRGMFEANIIATFIGDIEGRVIEANDAFFHMLGYDREDLATGRIHRTKITPPEWRDRDARTRAELVTLGRIEPFEKEYWRKDGSRVPVLIGAAVFQPDRVVAFVLDLSERKRAEQALRESEEQWKAVFENNPTMYFMVDRSGAIVSVNPLGAEQLGFTVDELIGRPVLNLFHGEDREAIERNWATCFERPGESMNWEARKIRKNGEVLWVRETARVMLIKDRPVALIACEDITERKRVSEALREVQRELAHATRVATMGQLTASIAHEVNQPIAATVTNAQAALRWLDARPPDLEESRAALARIVKDGRRAGDVISRIRGLISKAPPQKDRVHINGAIREVIELTRVEATKNGVAVRTELAEGLPIVEADRVGLQQVMLNLIINAVEAMSGVTEGARDLLVSSEKAGSDGVLVTVRDSGPGLAPPMLERPFDAFYTTKATGLGLGLSICRSIIEAHDGRLWAEANVPRGAVFQFTLPALPDCKS